MKQNILKEAIAEAKLIRESALNNAKLALEEAFAPKIQSMLSAKLSEEMGEEDEFLPEENEMSDEDINLDEIIAELESEEEDLNEAKDKDENDSDKETKKETKKDDKKSEKKSEEKGEKEDEDKEVGKMAQEDLAELIRDVIQAELNGGEKPAENEDEIEIEIGMGGEDELNTDLDPIDEEIDIDALLQEMMGEEDMDLDLDENMDTSEVINSILGAAGVTSAVVLSTYKDQIIDAIKNAINNGNSGLDNEQGSEVTKEELDTLRNELNEVNLLNAKLLYLNKIFRNKVLNETQKVRVINAFDKASNVKEVKVVYETLLESLKAPKNPIKESLGFASKSLGVAKKSPIIESNPIIDRFQKLANINKK